MPDSRPTYKLEIWTDGACSGNPGPGGWATLLKAYMWDMPEDIPINGQWAHIKDKDVTLSGGEKDTTNNRMELTAILNGLQQLNPNVVGHAEITVYTDSMNAVQSFTNWVKSWERNGWKTSKGETVKNLDLVQPIYELVKVYSPQFQHVKAHSGIPDNEFVDQLAVKERNKWSFSFTVPDSKPDQAVEAAYNKVINREIQSLKRDMEWKD